MKAHDMREMTLEELQIHHDSLLDELVNLRIKLAMRQLDNPVQVRHLRRDVARAKSILRDKTLGAKPGEVLGKTNG
ncbi:MAG: 50S ribosomal protein L29 [Candidatus Krumholzibacteria bacterium]|jgi:large subunit ribosomal protein L29|nr:50S ribosomal protein L29 [Candidatus Krumholzibacteria bacterium]MCK5618407.1 50S ribosomal protein L29 [Candidatus Krumholzibacteria bacterium]